MRELWSCSGRVFNFKSDSFVPKRCNCTACSQPLLELKTRPYSCPVCWSLSFSKDLNPLIKTSILAPLKKPDCWHPEGTLKCRNSQNFKVYLHVRFMSNCNTYVVLKLSKTDSCFAVIHNRVCDWKYNEIGIVNTPVDQC